MIRAVACVRDGEGKQWNVLGQGQQVNKRPVPHEVYAWFAADSNSDTIVSAILTLQGDPNWHVRYRSGPPTWTLNLIYSPTGEQLTAVFQRIGPAWRLLRWASDDADAVFLIERRVGTMRVGHGA